MNKPKKLKLYTKEYCFEVVAQWVTCCENGQYDDYMSYCNDNNLIPKDIDGIEQKNHVYALALIALGLEFPKDTCPKCYSDNVANEGPENDDNTLDMTCHDCSHQWNEK